MQQVVFFCLVLSVLAVDINIFPAKIAMPITFYDYEYYSNQIIDKLKTDSSYKTDMQKDNDDLTHLLCDFNICSQSTRAKSGYCPNHVHADSQTGFVQEQLVNGKPKLKNPNKNASGQTQKSYLAPHMWYSVNKYSKKVERNITLDRSSITSSGVPLYSFTAKSDFFYIDNDGWDYPNKSNGKHNYVFATHFHAAIKYSKDSNSMTISSDDDSWLFIDGKLAIDYGGTRAPTEKTFRINNDKFENNKEYTVDFFHADRCSTQASFSIFGPLTCDLTIGGKTDSDKDGVPDCQDGCPYNKYLVDSKEGCTCSDGTDKKDKKGDPCITCDMIITEALCNGINSDTNYNKNNLQCEWCPNGNNGNGKCKKKSTCDCTELAADNKCSAYVGSNGKKNCDLCIVSKGSSTVGCNTKTQCECKHFKTLSDCASASNSQYNCIWCGNQCVDGSMDSCPECSSYSSAQECLQVYDRASTTASSPMDRASACNWCTNGNNSAFNGKNGKCVKGECSCKDADLFIKVDNNATNSKVCGDLKDNFGQDVDPIKNGIGYYSKLSDFTNNKNKQDKICDYCIPSGSCLKKTEECNTCHLFDNDEDGCKKAAGCLFCGNSCIKEDTEQCDPCSTFDNDQDKCSNAYVSDSNGKPTTDKCVFCNEGACKESSTECPTCSEINADSSVYRTKYFTLTSAAKNCTYIKKAYIDVDSTDHPNYDKYKTECKANGYCSFIDSDFDCVSKCDKKNQDECENLEYCKYSSSSCTLKDESDIKKALNEDIANVRSRCLAQVYNKCDFCGFLNFYYENVTVNEENIVSNRTFYYPNLCVSTNSATKCPECESLISAYNNNLSDDAAKKLGPGTYTVIHRLSDGTAEGTCSSLSIEYNDASTDSNKKYSGLQVCGYCEGTGKCVALGDPAEFFNTTDKQRADYLFYSKQCDSDCHLYSENTYCYKSKLDCSWCKFQNGTALCYNSTEECPACKEYTTAYRCSDAGCRWCDLSSNCVTGNKDCPELSAIVGIAAGIIAAIIIAAVVGVALSAFASKKIYDAINEARETSMDSATSNPL